MAIKVLVISNYTNYHTNRPEAEIFIGLAKLGFEVHIMTDKSARYAQEFETVGINVIDFQPKQKLEKSEVQRIREVLVNKQIEIMHMFTSKVIINGIRASKGLPVKVVLYRGYSHNIRWYNPTAHFKHFHPRVDKIVCNSIGVEELFHRQPFFDNRKTITINKGHNVEWYKDVKPYDIRTELGIDPDAFLLVNVANNRKMKGIPYLLEAMNQLPGDLPIHLLLVGRRMDDEKNLQIVGSGNKKDHIHMIGFRDNALEIVASSNVFVLTSIRGESITKSVLEAMSLRVTPIISDIRGNYELVKDGQSGLVTPVMKPKELSEAILKLYNDQGLCSKLGQNARNRIENELSSEQTIRKYNALYQDLAKT